LSDRAPRIKGTFVHRTSTACRQAVHLAAKLACGFAACDERRSRRSPADRACGAFACRNRYARVLTACPRPVVPVPPVAALLPSGALLVLPSLSPSRSDCGAAGSA
jgi:hypothetical protein